MKRWLRWFTAPFRWLWAVVRWIWRVVTFPFRWVRGRWRATHRFFTEVPPDEPLTDLLTRPLTNQEARAMFLQGLIENLTALRQHLLRAVLAFALTTLFSLLFAEQLMAILAVPLNENAQTTLLGLFQQTPAQAVHTFMDLGLQGMAKMQVIEPTESIGVFMRVSLLAGLALAMPWLVLEVYLFVAPGLMPRTRLTLLWGIPLASALFLAGILFTYWIMLPAAVPFLYSFGGFKAAWRPSKYFDMVTSLMFWIGLAFQMPLVLYTLAGLGWIKARQLVDYWRIAVIAIAVVAAMVTPTVDPVNMGVVMLPMLLLYGFSIIGARIAENNRARAQASRP